MASIGVILLTPINCCILVLFSLPSLQIKSFKEMYTNHANFVVKLSTSLKDNLFRMLIGTSKPMRNNLDMQSALLVQQSVFFKMFLPPNFTIALESAFSTRDRLAITQFKDLNINREFEILERIATSTKLLIFGCENSL
ncbi:hypothetical protein CR513_28400, partial [Mucuna pruriens]